jgi:hypothetical protein
MKFIHGLFVFLYLSIGFHPNESRAGFDNQTFLDNLTCKLLMEWSDRNDQFKSEFSILCDKLKCDPKELEELFLPTYDSSDKKTYIKAIKLIFLTLAEKLKCKFVKKILKRQDLTNEEKCFVELLESSSLDDNIQFLESEDIHKKSFNIFNDFGFFIKNNISRHQHFDFYPYLCSSLLLHSLSSKVENGFFNEKTFQYYVYDQLCHIVHMMNVLLEKSHIKTANYDFFLNFIFFHQFSQYKFSWNERLSFTNTFFSEYAQGFDFRLGLKFDEFQNKINHYGNDHTIKRYSPKGLGDLYPFLFLPYPYELSIKDLNNTPIDGSASFWALGFSYNHVHADRAKMPPLIYFYHDLQHYQAIADSLCLHFACRKDKLPFFMSSLWRESDTYRKFLLKMISFYQEIMKKIKNKINSFESEDQKSIQQIFLFLINHENFLPFYKRISFLYCNSPPALEIPQVQSDDDFKSLIQSFDAHYLDALPSFYKNLSSHDRFMKLKQKADELYLLIHNDYDDTGDGIRDYSSNRMSYMEDLHDLTQASCVDFAIDPVAFNYKNSYRRTMAEDGGVCLRYKFYKGEDIPETRRFIENTKDWPDNYVLCRLIFNDLCIDGSIVQMSDNRSWIQVFEKE